MPPDVRRRVIRETAAILAAFVAGGVLLGIKAGTALTVAGISVVGLAVVAATAVVFMEIGFSEDRERAKADRRRDAPGG